MVSESFMMRKKLTLVSGKQYYTPVIGIFWGKQHKLKDRWKQTGCACKFLVADELWEDKFEVLL